MIVSALDYAELYIEMFRALFELIANSSKLLNNPLINPADIWNASYSASSFAYWVARSFLGVGGGFDVGRENLTALKNYSEMMNFLGRNATTIFGGLDGNRGLSAVLKNATTLVDQNFAVSLARALNESIRLAGKLLMNVNTTFV